jgi:hypothetical protein
MYIDVLGKGLTDRLLKYRTTSAINGTIIEMVMFSNNPKTFTKKLNRLMHMHKYIYIYIYKYLYIYININIIYIHIYVYIQKIFSTLNK